MKTQGTQGTPAKKIRGPDRRHRRFITRSLQVDNPVPGQVVNVAQGGLALESVEGLAVGQTYIFKIRLGEKNMRLAGRIQWCRLTTTRADGDSDAAPVYRSGVALVETVTGKAWREALRRMTEEPAYVIWHRKQGKAAAEALGEEARQDGQSQQADRAG